MCASAHEAPGVFQASSGWVPGSRSSRLDQDLRFDSSPHLISTCSLDNSSRSRFSTVAISQSCRGPDVNQDHQVIGETRILDVGVLAAARGLFRPLQHNVLWRRLCGKSHFSCSDGVYQGNTPCRCKALTFRLFEVAPKPASRGRATMANTNPVIKITTINTGAIDATE
jgi:hypothetical protein